MDMEDESSPRVVLLSDWQGTVVGLAYDPDSFEKDGCKTISLLAWEQRERTSSSDSSGEEEAGGGGGGGQGLTTSSRVVPTDQLQLQWSVPSATTPRVSSHVLDRLKGVARKCLFRRTVEELVEKLFVQDLHTKERAASELADLSHASREHKLKIAETPRALEGFVNLLQLNSAGITPHEVQCARAQTEATRAVLSLTSEQENRWIISEYPYALTGLVKVLTTNCEAEARKWAAQALGNLCAHSQEVRLKIGHFPYALAALVRIVEKDAAEAVREQGARTLGLLMKGHVEHKKQIATIPRAIEALVKMLSPHESAAGQKMGALCLAHLDHSEEILLEIASTPGALTALVGLLSSSDERAFHKLEHAAAGCTSRPRHHHHRRRRLRRSDSRKHKADDDEEEEVPADKLATLVGVLLNQENITLQKRTALALAKIYSQERTAVSFRAASAAVSLGCSRRSEHAFQQMAMEEGALDGMEIEARATNALNFLAAARERKLLMSDYPNAMLASVGPLLKEGTRRSSVGAFGALVLASLARAQGNRRRIAECYGALAGLARLLGKSECAMAQAAAACALANIAHGDKQIQYNITRVPNSVVVGSLVTLLLTRDNPFVQAQAARALACFASVRDRDNNLVIIEEYPNILSDLARSLFQSDVPSVQEEAAWALVSIGHRHLGH